MAEVTSGKNLTVIVLNPEEALSLSDAFDRADEYYHDRERNHGSLSGELRGERDAIRRLADQIGL